MSEPPLFAVAAVFAAPGPLLAGARALRAHRFGRVDAFSPAPVPGLDQALHGTADREVRIVGVGAAILGFAGFFTFCAWSATVAYVFIIGGRPGFAWPDYLIPSLSVGAATGALAAFGAFLVLNRLPRLNHPIFNARDFGRVSADRYLLSVEAGGRDFEPDEVERVLRNLAAPPVAIERVPR